MGLPSAPKPRNVSDLPSGELLPAPISWRRDIPLYYNKTAAEYRADVYERYDELVSRQMIVDTNI